MRFGIKLPHSGPLASRAAIRTIAMEAESLNFDSVWVHDHISYGKNWSDHRASGLIEQITAGSDPKLFEAITTLAYVAGLTERIRIGTSVLVLPLRNPLVLGRELMTLQALSAGRLLLGVAVGDYPDEFEALRVPYQERGKITDEYLDVLLKVFRDGTVRHRGTYVSCDAAYFYPTVTPPPVLVGGGVIAGPVEDSLALPVLRRVARFADGWMPDWGSPDLIKQGVATIRQLRREYGRENDEVTLAWTTKLYVADTDEEARYATARSLQGANTLANAVTGFGARSPDKSFQKSLVGTPTSIAAKIEPYADAGADLVVMTCLAPDEASFVEMLRRFHHEVASKFQAGHEALRRNS